LGGELLWQLGEDVLCLLPPVVGGQRLCKLEQLPLTHFGSGNQDLLVDRHCLGNQLLLGIEVGEQAQFVYSGHAGSGRGFEQGDRLQLPAIHNENVGVSQPVAGLGRTRLDEILDERFRPLDLPSLI